MKQNFTHLTPELWHYEPYLSYMPKLRQLNGYVNVTTKNVNKSVKYLTLVAKNHFRFFSCLTPT